MPEISVPMVINTRSSDEELIQYLNTRQVGDPFAGNVVTDTNPFDAEPRNLHDALYLGNFGVPNSREKKGAIKEAGSGYWKSTDNRIIFTGYGNSGWKSTLAFYEGKPPDGKRTGWIMHLYQAEEGSPNEATRDKENNTLCRVVLQNDIATDGVNVEEVLLLMPEQEEDSSTSRNAVNEFQSEQEITVSSKTPQNCGHESTTESMDVTSGFSEEGYLALADFGDDLDLDNLYSPGASSASSDNSIRITIDSDEYFDPDALLMDLQDERQQESEEEHRHLSFNVEEVLLQMLEQEENSSTSRNAANVFQSEQEITVPSKTPQNAGHESVTESMDVTSDFLNGNYLALADFGDDLDLSNLYSPGASSASSDNSSRITIDSDECLDPDVLSVDLQGERQQESVEEHHHLSFNISAVAKSNQVFARLPSPDCSDSIEAADVKDGIASSFQNLNEPTSRKRVSSVDELQHNREASPDGRSESIQPIYLSDNTHDRRTPHRKRFVSVGKIARLKKYCCFGSF